MYLPERIENINRQLLEHFGKHDTGEPIWRVVYAEEQLEKRLGTFHDFSGEIYLRTVTEVREVKKYPWDKGKYILERLVVVPAVNLIELLGTKLSYEPMWTFEDNKQKPLPPLFRACKLVVDTVYAAQYSNHTLAKYKEDLTIENQFAKREERIQDIENELFGDESGLKGASMDSGSASFVPHNYEKSK
jgi:hypothetical protein